MSREEDFRTCSLSISAAGNVACVAGVRKGRERELWRETTRPTRTRAPKFPLPLPLLTPATQATGDTSHKCCVEIQGQKQGVSGQSEKCNAISVAV